MSETLLSWLANRHAEKLTAALMRGELIEAQRIHDGRFMAVKRAQAERDRSRKHG